VPEASSARRRSAWVIPEALTERPSSQKRQPPFGPTPRSRSGARPQGPSPWGRAWSRPPRGRRRSGRDGALAPCEHSPGSAPARSGTGDGRRRSPVRPGTAWRPRAPKAPCTHSGGRRRATGRRSRRRRPPVLPGARVGRDPPRPSFPAACASSPASAGCARTAPPAASLLGGRPPTWPAGRPSRS